MVNEVLYCERLMYLEWVQGEWDSNRFTADGTRVHKRVDASRKKLPAKKPAKGDAKEAKDGAKEASNSVASPEAPEARGAPDADEAPDAPYQARSVWLSSEALGLTAKLDVVDVEGDRAMAVEFKRGKRPNLPEGAYLPERAQLCAHVLLLREHGYDCNDAEIYFAGDRQRTRIEITDELIAQTTGAIARVRELARSQRLPPPLVDSPKCPHCSLNMICLPDETNTLRAKRLPLAPPSEPPTDTETAETEAGPRRLIPGRDDKVPVYVTTQGATVRLDGHRLLVFAEGEKKSEARLPHTSQLSLFGNVQISTQAIRSLLGRGIGIHFFSYGGWWSGACLGADSNNVQLRLAQYRGSQDADLCLSLATRWVHSKIANSRTLLRRNHRSLDQVVLNELKILARKALHAPSQESLLGIEGSAARTYFGAFSGMLTEESLAAGYSFDGRNRRPPRDRLNALLSFSYSMLTKDLLAACRAAGLDPLLGFYHQPQFGRPSLALDLMEEFRPILADSTVLQAINNGVVKHDDFVESAGSVALGDKARRRFIQTYEKRIDQQITHPVFGYRISYRRVLEVQARLLGRLLLGEIDEFPTFQTR
jgi:CRISPR-associated protein Cas1